MKREILLEGVRKPISNQSCIEWENERKREKQRRKRFLKKI
jgi:hypothetical protein